MTWYVCRICFMIQRTCFFTNKNISMISGHFWANFLNHQNFQKILKIAIFAQNRFFQKCLICFHAMIYGWKCHLGTLKSHLEPIFDIHDVIRAFFGKSIFFDFWAKKNFFLDFCWCRNYKICNILVKFCWKCVYLHHNSFRKKKPTITQRNYKTIEEIVKKCVLKAWNGTINSS